MPMTGSRLKAVVQVFRASGRKRPDADDRGPGKLTPKQTDQIVASHDLFVRSQPGFYRFCRLT